MSIFTKAYNSVRNKLPVLRKPSINSTYDNFLNDYSWILTSRNKSSKIGWNTYYKAGYNVWVRACINVYINEVRNLGFSIKSPEESHKNVVKTHYLEGLFKNPMGFNSNDTYATYQSSLWGSLLLLGDAFSEVIYDDEATAVPIGLKHIPTHLMMYYPDTDQWGLRDTNKRFEPENLIHIKEPGIRGSVWGESPIDTLANDLVLEIYGRNFTKEILERKGLDPSGVIEFDSNLSDAGYNQEIARLQAMANGNRRGTMVLRGAKFNSVGITNEDMEYSKLMSDIRDRILAVYGVPPSKVSIIETASLDHGSGESQSKNFKKTFGGKAKLFEDGFNKVLGRSGFREIFKYQEMDLEDKLIRAQTESLRLQNNTLTVNEVRQSYGQTPLPDNFSNEVTKGIDKYKLALKNEGLIK